MGNERAMRPVAELLWTLVLVLDANTGQTDRQTDRNVYMGRGLLCESPIMRIATECFMTV